MISHASITSVNFLVLAREFSQAWGGRWHLTPTVTDFSVLIYRDGDGPVSVDTRGLWISEEVVVEALWDAARSLVPQQILDALEYGSCVDAFVKRIDEETRR